MTEFSPQFEEFFNKSQSPLKDAIDRRVRENKVQLHLARTSQITMGRGTVFSHFVVATKELPNGMHQPVGAVGFDPEGTVHGLVVHPGLGLAEKGTITMAILKAAHTLGSKTKLFDKVQLKPDTHTSNKGLGVARKIVPGAAEIQPGTRVKGEWNESDQLSFLRQFRQKDFICPECFSRGWSRGRSTTSEGTCKNCRGTGVEPVKGRTTLNRYLGIE